MPRLARRSTAARSVAVLLRQKLIGIKNFGKKKDEQGQTLQRRPLVKRSLEGADDNLLVIAGLGSSNWDITEAGDRPLNMPLWGAMGAPVGMGLGLALAQPTKRVLVITGDGDMLMSLGSLATVATQQPENLAIVVLDNEKFGETGNQATHTSPRNNGPTDFGRRHRPRHDRPGLRHRRWRHRARGGRGGAAREGRRAPRRARCSGW